jgi:hypothetical protein
MLSKKGFWGVVNARMIQSAQNAQDQFSFPACVILLLCAVSVPPTFRQYRSSEESRIRPIAGQGSITERAV